MSSLQPAGIKLHQDNYSPSLEGICTGWVRPEPSDERMHACPPSAAIEGGEGPPLDEALFVGELAVRVHAHGKLAAGTLLLAAQEALH